VGQRSDRALLKAAEAGDLEAARAQLAAGARLEARDPYSYTPLMRAASAGHEGVVRALLAAGAAVHATDKWHRTALFGAGGAGVVHALAEAGADLEHRDEDGATALTTAAYWGTPAVVTALVARGASPNQRTTSGVPALHSAAVRPDGEKTRCLVALGADVEARGDTGRTALWAAARAGSVASLRALLDGGAELTGGDRAGETVVQAAASMGRVEAIEFLVARGASVVDAQPSSLRTQEVRVALLRAPTAAAALDPATRALLTAAAQGDLRGVEAALAQGASFTATDTADRNALALAVDAGQFKVAQRIEAAELRASGPPSPATDLLVAATLGALADVNAALAAGAPLSTRDPRGHSALELASEYGHTRVVKRLLHLGAAPDGYPEYPALCWAAYKGHLAVARHLLKAGADPQRPNEHDETPLRIAVAQGHAKLVKALLLGGADSAGAPAPSDGGEISRLLSEAARGRLRETEALRGTAERPEDCPVCAAIGASASADREQGERLPDAADRLERRGSRWCCVVCGGVYTHERDRGWYVTGHEDDETLLRR
jgi:ankyrin repeat protein